MSRLRLPIWMLSALVLLIGLDLGALKNPSELVASAVFSLTVGLLCVSPVVAFASTGCGRLAWLAFSLVGAAYLGLTFFGQVVPTPRFAPSGWVAAALDHLEQAMNLNQPSALNSGTVFTGSGNTFVVDIKKSPGYLQNEKFTEFRQIGHSLATLMFSLVAAIIVLLIPARKHAPGRP